MDGTDDIIKIIQVKSRDRIALPKEARDFLKADKHDHIAILKGHPGIHVVKVKLDLSEE